MATDHLPFELVVPLEVELVFFAQRRWLRNVAAYVALDGVDALDFMAGSHDHRGPTCAEVEATPDWHDLRDLKFERMVRDIRGGDRELSTV